MKYVTVIPNGSTKPPASRGVSDLCHSDNFAKDAKFSDYRTYKWVEIKRSDHVNSLVEGQIKSALEAELATKGLTKTDSDDADLYIGYQTAIGTKKQFNSYSTGWGMGPGWGGGWYRGYGGMTSETTTGSTSTIYIGQLALDMYDSKNKDLVCVVLLACVCGA